MTLSISHPYHVRYMTLVLLSHHNRIRLCHVYMSYHIRTTRVTPISCKYHVISRGYVTFTSPNIPSISHHMSSTSRCISLNLQICHNRSVRLYCTTHQHTISESQKVVPCVEDRRGGDGRWRWRWRRCVILGEEDLIIMLPATVMVEACSGIRLTSVLFTSKIS